MRLGSSESRAYRRTSTWLLTVGVLATLVLAGFSAFALAPSVHGPASAGAPTSSAAAAVSPAAAAPASGSSAHGSSYLAQLEASWHGTPISAPAVPGAALPFTGTAVTYSVALAAILAASSGFDNATGWAAVVSGGLAPSTPMSIAPANITGACPVTWVNGTPPAFIYEPATPSSAAPGASNFYFFYLVSANASGTLLAGTVVNGTAALVFSFSATACPSMYPSGISPIPANVLDSPAIVTDANASGGAAFLSSFATPNRQWTILGPGNFSGFLEPPFWDVNYTSACGASFEAAFQALTGELLFSQTTLQCNYAVNFLETGLANGTSWSLLWNNTSFYGSQNGTIGFSARNGTYPFFLYNVSGYNATPLSGNVTVAGAGVNQSIVFALLPGNFTVSFVASGLPNGTGWDVFLAGEGFAFGTGTTLAFAAENGSYAFNVFATGFAATPANGTIVVNGANLTENVSFVALPSITFVQTGLPALQGWEVSLNGTFGIGGFDGTNVTFYEPNGTYAFNVSGPAGFLATPASGNVTVAGSNQTVNVSFSLAPGNYSVTFHESGLPGFSLWAVTFFYGPNGTNSSTQGNFVPGTVVFAAMNGTYNWSLATGVPGFAANVSNGSVVVNGTNLSVFVGFTAVAYNVTFTETGLAAGTAWSVTIGSDTEVSVGTTIDFALGNGSFNYTVSAVPNYTVGASSGSVVVNGSTENVSVSFSLVTYLLTFSETGLPTGTSWSVTIGATSVSSTSLELNFTKANGSFTYTVDAVAGFSASPATATVTVNGGAATVAIAFSVYAFPVTFTESGLPSGTTWSVTIGATTHQSTTTSIVFQEGNGSYTYTVAGIAGFTASSTMGPVTVSGASVGVSITFTVSKYTVTFSETGLPSGTNWSVTFNGTTVSSTTSTIVFHAPNSTYSFTVGGASGYQANNSSGNVDVAGHAKTVDLSFSSSSASPGFLGLPGSEGYYVLGGVIALVAVLAGAGLAMRSRRMRKERAQKEEAASTEAASTSTQNPPRNP